MTLQEKLLPQTGSIYEHYKGQRYQILTVGRHTETLEELVVYQALQDSEIWVRPVSKFLETISLDGQMRPRFQLVQPSQL